MTDLQQPAATWAGVPQLETSDQALAGPGGPMNAQALALMARDNHMRERIAALELALNGYVVNAQGQLVLAGSGGSGEEPPPPVMTGVFVDSVNGNDANNGTSQSTPKRTLAAAAAAVAAGSTVWLSRGSVFRESLKPTADCAIKVYGSGAAPVIDGANVITGWTRHDPGALPDVWSKTVQRELPIKGEDRMGVWKNGVRPRLASTLGDLQTNGGWFCFDPLEAPGVGDDDALNETIYIKSTVEPGATSDVYEYTARKNGLHWYDQAATVDVEGPIEIKRALDHYNAVSGGLGTLRRLLLRDGSLHHLVARGTVFEDILGDEFNPNTQGPAPFTFYQADGAAFNPTATRLMWLGAGGAARLNDGSAKAFYGHSSLGDALLDGGTLIQCVARGMNFGGIASRALVTLRGCLGEDTTNYAFDLYGPTKLEGTLVRDTGVGGFIAVQIRKSTGADIEVVNHCGYSKAGTCVENAAGVSTFTNCAFKNLEGTGFGSTGGTGGTPTLTRCILDFGNRTAQELDNLAGDHNVFFAPPWNDMHPVLQFATGGFQSWNVLAFIQARNGSNANSVWCKPGDQTSGNANAFWLGVKLGTGGPEVGDYRINPTARVYTGNENGVARIGTFLDGTPLTQAGAQQHWDYNARAWAAGPPTRSPRLPVSLAEMRTYLDNPGAWNFYP